MKNPFNKQNDDAYVGFNDAAIGYYNKRYRYTRDDRGERYDYGIEEAIKQGASIEHYIEYKSCSDRYR